MSSTLVASPEVSAHASEKRRAISGLTIFLGAFLLFQIQPISAIRP